MSVVDSFNLSNLAKEISKIHQDENRSSKYSDITSILDGLENGNLETLTQRNIYIKTLEEELTLFENWTSTTLKKTLENTDKYLLTYKFLSRISKLSKKLRGIYQKNIIGISTSKKKYKSVCPVCSKNLTKGKCKDHLTAIENHSHLKEYFQSFKLCPDQPIKVR